MHTIQSLRQTDRVKGELADLIRQTLNTKTPKRFQDNFENWEKWFISRNHQNTNAFSSLFLSFLHLFYFMLFAFKIYSWNYRQAYSNNSLAWIFPNISILKWMQGIPVNSHINQFQYQPHLQFYLFHRYWKYQNEKELKPRRCEHRFPYKFSKKKTL